MYLLTFRGGVEAPNRDGGEMLTERAAPNTGGKASMLPSKYPGLQETHKRTF